MHHFPVMSRTSLKGYQSITLLLLRWLFHVKHCSPIFCFNDRVPTISCLAYLIAIWRRFCTSSTINIDLRRNSLVIAIKEANWFHAAKLLLSPVSQNWKQLGSRFAGNLFRNLFMYLLLIIIYCCFQKNEQEKDYWSNTL